MNFPVRLIVGAALAFALAVPGAWAAETNVAVAANFTDAAKEIAAAFKAKTGNDAILSFGASGQLYTQITQDAPFQVFLSADDERPKKAVTDGLGRARQRVHLRDRQAGAVEQAAGPGRRRGDVRSAGVQQAVHLQPGRRALWRGRGRDDEVAEAVRRAAAETRRRRQHHPGLSVRRHRQRRDRLRGAVAGDERRGRLALDGAAEPVCPDPAGRGAAEEGRRQRGRDRVHGLPERTGGHGHHRADTATRRAARSRNGWMRCRRRSGRRSV